MGRDGTLLVDRVWAQVEKLWFFDPMFAIMFAVFIAYNWGMTAKGTARVARVAACPTPTTSSAVIPTLTLRRTRAMLPFDCSPAPRRRQSTLTS